MVIRSLFSPLLRSGPHGHTLLLLVLLLCCAPLVALAQPGAIEGWTRRPEKDGVFQIDHESGRASILIGPAPLANAAELEPSLRKFGTAMDKPGGCVGISKQPVRPVPGLPQARMLTSDGGSLCTMILSPVKDGNAIMVIGIEMPGANAGARQAAITFATTIVKQMDGKATNSTTPSTTRQNAAPPARTPIRTSAAPAQAPNGRLARASDPRGLIGMWRSDWVENRILPFQGMTLVADNNTLIFTAGGYFFNGVPSGVSVDDAGAQETMRNNPDAAGRYTVGNGVITLNYPNGDRETVEYRRSGQDWLLTFRGKPMSPKMLFVTGGGLKGVYSTTRITNAGSGTFVVGEDDYDFSLDGRFALGGSVSFSSAAVSSVGGRKVRRGTYVIRNSALYLSFDDGEKQVLTLFQETHGQAIWFNDQMYKPAGMD